MKWCACEPLCRARHDWRGLTTDARAELQGKLKLLYRQPSDEAAFNFLELDKQQALRLLLKRFRAKGLWSDVLHITNVYGRGGVGFNFIAAQDFAAQLAARRDFSKLFAAHKNATTAFFELGQPRAALHLLQHTADNWSAHFDLYAPRGGLMSLFRHLHAEKLRATTPDWLAISRELERQSRK